MKYLTIEQVLFIHSRLISETGGSHGLRDLSLLESALSRPKSSFENKDLYPSIYLKAASLFQSLVQNHPFIDGNKRVGLTTTFVFLQSNGIVLKPSQDDLYITTQKIAQNQLSIEEIALWLETSSWMRGFILDMLR